MGADLTIKKSGRYFRDSYNNGNSWWLIGMSYWEESQILSQNKMLTEDGCVTSKGAAYLLKSLERKPIPTFTEWKRTKVGKEVAEGYKETLGPVVPSEEIRDFYEDLCKHLEESKDFWREAIRLNSEVVWSV